MEIPSKIEYKAITFADGENGYKLQHYRNELLGIDVIKSRKNRDNPWTIEYSIDKLPDQVFDSLEKLAEAVKDL